MIKWINRPQANLYPLSIFLYEDGTREPPLIVLLRYAQLAGIPVDVLIDDQQKLPKNLPVE